MEAPYGHMLSTLDAASQLHRLGVISRRELRGVRRLLSQVPMMPQGALVPITVPPNLQPAMGKVWMATLMPATWTVQ